MREQAVMNAVRPPVAPPPRGSTAGIEHKRKNSPSTAGRVPAVHLARRLTLEGKLANAICFTYTSTQT